MTVSEGALLWLVLVSLLVCCRGCDFPDYVQSRYGEIRRDWHGHLMRSVRNNARQYSSITSFHGGVMQASILGGSLAKSKPKPFTRKCIQYVGNGKYLTSHKDVDAVREPDYYMCVQFLKRSDDVIQLKISEISNVSDTRLCEDRGLVLDDWPLVNRDNLFHSYQRCPLKGGFNIIVYDKSRAEGVCDAYDGGTRLESECLEGEGMHFRFRTEECVPKGIHMHQHQRVVCMANWQDGSYTFSVLRHASSEHMWCFRYPTSVVEDGAEEFSAFLFKDLHCDRLPSPPSREYIRMDVIRDVSPPLERLCDDDFQACSYWDDACEVPGSKKFLTCAKRCGICEDSKPSVCSIPPGFRGEWLESLGDTRKRVSIDDTFLIVEDYTSLRCIQWQRQNQAFQPDDVTQMFVTTYDNGCRPRYSCAHLKKKAPSVLRYKLSLSQIWPFDGVDPKHIDCSGFHFKDDDVPFGSIYRSKHQKTLISETERVYVDCHFKRPKMFEVVFADGALCNGRLTQEGLSSNTKMKLQLENCPNHQAEQEFACLDSTQHGSKGEQLIVTETLDTFNRIRCFVFPVPPKLTFYLLPTNHCHEGAIKLISSNWIKPLATFKQSKPITSSSVRVDIIATKKGENERPSGGAEGNQDGEGSDLSKGRYENGGNEQPSSGRGTADSIYTHSVGITRTLIYAGIAILVSTFVADAVL